MEGLSCGSESWACATSSTSAIEERQRSIEGEEEERGRCLRLRRSKSMGINSNNNNKKKKNQVLLEGYVDEDLARTKSLTDDDLEELKGCLDLGFGFSYDEIPELCNTLPALELCYSMSQKFIDHSSPAPDAEASSSPDSLSSSIANWRISSPDPIDLIVNVHDFVGGTFTIASNGGFYALTQTAQDCIDVGKPQYEINWG